nr:hypothetical protein [Klebsiella pneumoniae subsp. pneumoniae]
MAKALNLATVAEGWKPKASATGCASMAFSTPGWLYSKALPKEQFILWAEHNLHAH